MMMAMLDKRRGGADELGGSLDYDGIEGVLGLATRFRKALVR